jgi:hypothetical protein
MKAQYHHPLDTENNYSSPFVNKNTIESSIVSINLGTYK